MVESDTKIQGFNRRAESLMRSLQTASAVLHEKKSSVDKECSQDTVKSDLKAEALMTSLLMEKLYSAELATAVRGNGILRCEVQNAMDNHSCITRKMKELEMQALFKITEERDVLCDEVKQYSENNRLLNSEVGMLKKVEALDEDVLMKEGQITILKDALGKPFDLLAY